MVPRTETHNTAQLFGRTGFSEPSEEAGLTTAMWAFECLKVVPAGVILKVWDDAMMWDR